VSELQEAAGHLVIADRGMVIADTSVPDLIASASAPRGCPRSGQSMNDLPYS
jgi:hypothetical protein